MRIALPLSLAALLFATPVLAAAPPASPARTDQAQSGPSRSRPARASQTAKPTPAAKPTPSRQAQSATATARPTATRHVSTRLPRVIHGIRTHNHARGVEASHPGLREPETDSATPQVVHFPGAITSGLPTVLSGGSLSGPRSSPLSGPLGGGLNGGYCGQMLMPAVALREVSRGFSGGHAGIDLMAAHGTPIRAAAAGSVIYAGWYYAYGNIVDIRHTDGVVTRYAHMSAFGPGIASGAEVGAGDVIGNVGATGRATGPHIHFEVRMNGRAVDPRPYLALASCDGTSPREEILEAYADERPRATPRRPAARSRQAARSQAQPIRR